jgi:hypothetical protein
MKLSQGELLHIIAHKECPFCEGPKLDDTLLTRLERAGGRGVLDSTATREERNALALYLIALRKQGHAIVADEVMECGELSGAIRVTHFLSCERCKKGAL